MNQLMEIKEEWLSEQHITNVDMLKTLLKRIRPNYYYGQNIITPGEKSTEHDAIVKEILRISTGQSVVRTDALKEKLPYIPTEKIAWSLSTSPEFIWISEGKYFLMNQFVLSEEDANTISEHVANECELNGYASITDLPLGNIQEENYRVIVEGERVKFLAKISIDIDVKTGQVSFALPDFGLGYKDTIVEGDVWAECKDDLVRGNDVWGMIELGYRSPEDFDIEFEYESKRSRGKTSRDGRIRLISFKNFCPYQIDLDQYKDARREFSTDEWIDIILGAVDYNANGYETEEQKLTMLTRLLPFVEKRLNLIELAPKGTGKSYLFGNVSRFGWLSSGGVMSRAKMFYDQTKRKEGLIAGNDFVTLDEVQTICCTQCFVS